MVAYPSDPNVPLDTVIFKFGPGSAKFPFGTSTLQTTGGSEFDFSTGDWTVEGSIYLTSGHAGFTRPIIWYTDGFNYPFWLYVDPSGHLIAHGTTSLGGAAYGFDGGDMSAYYDSWVDVELDRTGDTFTLRINGVTAASSTNPGVVLNAATGGEMQIGGQAAIGNNLGGNEDEIRITNQYSRYLTDYTPAVAPFEGPCGTTVPDVVGLTQADATTAITGAGLTLGTVTTAHSFVQPFGYVISQSPVGGTPEAPGFPVDIQVSLGVATVTVPNVVGLTLAAATTALAGAGLIVGVVTSGPSLQPLGRITAELPTAGTVVASGSAVNLTQSDGLIPVPNVVGEQLILAENTIMAAGLTVGPITAEQLSGITPGTVNGQSPAAGTGVLPGTSVSLISVSAITNAFDVEPTVISQYANSPTLLRLVENMAQYIDPSADFLNFFSFVWNVDTAVGFGLDIWGRIVGVSRVLPIAGSLHDFGFHNSDSPPDWEPFNQGPFFNGNANTGAYTLPDDAYRTLILTKALANITATNAQALNQLVRNLFPGRGKCFVQDTGGMSMSYVFEFALSTVEYAILTQSGVLPHPAGVLVSVFVVPGTSFVGFSEAGAGTYQPFGYGQFYIPGE
jgi:beta-lactam-binding protein with PASTA domain